MRVLGGTRLQRTDAAISTLVPAKVSRVDVGSGKPQLHTSASSQPVLAETSRQNRLNLAASRDLCATQCIPISLESSRARWSALNRPGRGRQMSIAHVVMQIFELPPSHALYSHGRVSRQPMAHQSSLMVAAERRHSRPQSGVRYRQQAGHGTVHTTAHGRQQCAGDVVWRE